MAAAHEAFDRLGARLGDIRHALELGGLDGWLLYDLKARNPIAGALLGQDDLSRRYFVYLPRSGEPTAIVHGIEQGPWHAWPWQKRVYSEWRVLDVLLADVLPAGGTIAMEYSERDAVPFLDLVPAGVIELVRGCGVDVVSSGELITRFHSRWSDDAAGAHRRTAAVLADVAADTFAWLAHGVQDGAAISEAAMREHVLAELRARGAAIGADCIAATGRNAADPHYSPAGRGATFGAGDLVMLDLWAKESDDAVFADQTWMACLAETVPARAAELFAAIRDARDAAVGFLTDSWRAGRLVTGAEVDDVAREVVRSRGFGEHFVHRTGHSIDRATHGAGPNIDNFETRELRTLIPGIGFSIEPGIYIAREVGMRTEINVYIGDDGPEVTTPRPQTAIAALYSP